MNLPTKITVSRIVSTPLFFVFFMLPQWVSFASGGALPIRTLFILNGTFRRSRRVYRTPLSLGD